MPSSLSLASMIPSSSTVQRLPNELLAHIFSYLDSPSKFPEFLREDPEKISRPVSVPTGSNLKAISLVCRTWRGAVLRLLFRHVVWSFQRFHKPKATDVASGIPVLDFLRKNGLSKDVETFMILIDPPKEAEGARYANGQFWGLLPPDDSPPQPPKSWNMLWSAISVESSQFSSNPRPASADGLTASEANSTAPRVWDNNWLWRTLFDQIDPLRITLVCSPDILSSLLSRTVDTSSEWAFNSHYHVVSLSREPLAKGSSDLGHSDRILPSHNAKTECNLVPSDLFSIRDWTGLILNEGSFVPVYAAYEFFHYSPPSLVSIVLSTTDPSFSCLRKTLNTYSYIATFPLSRHVRAVVIPHCPVVDNLYVQMMPTDPGFWNDTDMLAHIDITDLWLECDMGYSLIMREIFDPEVHPGMKYLQLFESYDSRMPEAWSMVMQYIQLHGLRGWRMPRDGYFLRDESQTEP